jgi:predicted PurR-regulated permease PerM
MHEKCKDEQLKRILQREPIELPHSIKQQIHFTLYRLPKSNRTLSIVLHYLLYGAIIVLAALVFLFFFLWNHEKTKQAVKNDIPSSALEGEIHFPYPKEGFKSL